MLRIGGYTPLSTVDYPDKLASVIFCQGCAWDCTYCHNPELKPILPSKVRWVDIIEHLEHRKGKLDAVVFSGGEPTLQKDLFPAIQQVKDIGYKVCLHTAGIHPIRLKQCLPILDYVVLDIKATHQSHSKVTQVYGSGNAAWHSFDLILDSRIPHQIHIL